VFKWLLAMLFGCDATFPPYSLDYAWRASPYIWGLPWGYQYFAPTGLETLVVGRGKRPHPSPSPERRGVCSWL